MLLPLNAVLEGEYRITRTLPLGRQVQVGYLYVYTLNGKRHYKTKPDPTTADNIERLKQIVQRRMEQDGFRESRPASPQDQ